MEIFLTEETSAANAADELDSLICDVNGLMYENDQMCSSKKNASIISSLMQYRDVFIRIALENEEPLKFNSIKERYGSF